MNQAFKTDGKNVFDQPINIDDDDHHNYDDDNDGNDFKTYENRKIASGHGDNYTTGYLLDYAYFRDVYKIITIDLSKQQALDADPRAIQLINFTANFDRTGNKRISCILEEVKETVFTRNFSQGTVKVL